MKRKYPRGLYSPELLESRIAPATFIVKVLADAGPDSLRQAVLDANARAGADTIVFDKNLPVGNIVLTSGEIDITDSVAIKGLGIDRVIISGDNASRIFNIDDGTAAVKVVAISNLSLIDGSDAGNGGAILDFESLTLDKVVLASNAATNGGALWADTEGKLVVKNSIVTGNTATGSVAGLYLQAAGGISVSKTTVTYNQATGTTSGIYALNTGTKFDTVLDSLIVANNTQDRGGAIQVGGGVLKKTVIKNSTFTGNTNTGNNSGGALYLEDGNIVIDKSTFSGNSAGEGGAIGDNFVTSLVIKNSRFLNNTATDAGGGGGGALYSNGTHPITITGSLFLGNRSAGDGGAISADQSDATLKIAATIFDHNTAANFGGALTLGAGVITDIKTSHFRGNTAGASGGAIFADTGALLTITGGTFSENASVSNGGAIFVTGAAADGVKLTVTGSVFTGNQAGGGGAITFESDADLLIKGAKFFSNLAVTSDGGAIAVSTPGNVGTRTIFGSLFRWNSAFDDAGAIDTFDTLAITGSTFLENTVDHGDGQGGAIRSIGGDTVVTNSIIMGNFAATGGGIFDTANLTVVGGKVTGNSARQDPNLHGV